MRLFGYYAFHSFKNQLKKIFKSWVIIFILACGVIGGGIGFGAAKISEMAESRQEEEAPEDVLEEMLPEDVVEEAEAEDNAESEEGGFTISDGAGGTVSGTALAEAIAGVAVLVILALHCIFADKSGSAIFLPADVTLLFPSPMKPQSVLLFRLSAQLGATVFASIYLIAQLPNLMQTGFGALFAWMVIAVWMLSLIGGRLLQVFLYTLASVKPGLKKYIRVVVYAVLAVCAAFLYLTKMRTGKGWIGAAADVFAQRSGRWIPLWGWLRAVVGAGAEGDARTAVLFLALTLAGFVVLCVVIWRMKADFYEEAMAKSEQTAQLLEAAAADNSGRLRVVRQRKKDRSDSIRRDEFSRGEGANVFFWKSIYNRFRFAYARVFTKTMLTYFALAAAVCFACRVMFQTDSVIPLAGAFAVFVFYRALGDPLSEDVSMEYFVMIPESMHAKLFYSLLGGIANCFLDIIIPLIVGTIVIGAPVWRILPWIPFILSIDVFATCTGTFIAVSIPKGAGRVVRQILQIMFLYFGLVPDIAILAIGIILGHTGIALLIASAVNVLLSAIFFALTPGFIAPAGGYRPVNVGNGTGAPS